MGMSGGFGHVNIHFYQKVEGTYSSSTGYYTEPVNWVRQSILDKFDVGTTLNDGDTIAMWGDEYDCTQDYNYFYYIMAGHSWGGQDYTDRAYDICADHEEHEGAFNSRSG